MGERSGEATCLRLLGYAPLRRDQPDEAQQHFQGALAIFRQIGDLGGQADCLSDFAVLARCRNQSEEAVQYAHEALPMQRRRGIGSVKPTLLRL